ncbi:MAG: tyrosine-protein phosphatase [Proteobacteria bacterium]|nr:tyrosine-protein phosphatase [Pseudomonadota bacterium]
MQQTHHPARALTLQKGENVRDLGGYSTRDGGQTQWRRFVRCGDMFDLTPADQRTLLDYGITTVIDLRMEWEVADKPNVFATSDEVRFLRHDFWGDRFDDYRSPDRRASPARKLADLYCSGLEKSGFVMAQIMTTFADSPDVGYAFHCRSGKDRTGLVAAILLSVAGVPGDVICADFELTSTYLKSHAVNPIDAKAPGQWQRHCDAQTMALTLAFLVNEYGGVDAYLKSAGVTDAQLKVVRDKLVGP